jgi:hypothetical protein
VDNEDDPIEIPADWLPFTGNHRPDYQIALGAFLVAFNSIENTVNQLIASTLSVADRRDKIATAVTRQFNHRLEILEWLLIHRTDVPSPPFGRLRELADHRASLAHGHLRQDPNTGEFEVVGKGKSYDWNPPAILELRDRALKLDQELQDLLAYVWFQRPHEDH